MTHMIFHTFSPKAIYYELGFIVLAVLGVVFVLLMPLVGLFFCLCRCCENCGGEMHQRHRKNADCQRGFYTFSLITSSLFIAYVYKPPLKYVHDVPILGAISVDDFRLTTDVQSGYRWAPDTYLYAHIAHSYIGTM